MTDLQKAFYDEIVLSEEEVNEALLNARIKKYFHEKNKEYWQELEGRKAEAGQTGLRAKASGKVAVNEQRKG